MGVPPPFKNHRTWRNIVFLSGNHAEAWAHGGGGGVAYIYIYIYLSIYLCSCMYKASLHCIKKRGRFAGVQP